MPNLPFSTPVTDYEHWANILHDLGAPPTSQKVNDTYHAILLQLDSGLFGTANDSYGSGVDGVQAFNGTATITLWNGTTLAPSSSVYTLTQDLWLADQSSISSGVSIVTAGFRIFCQGELSNAGTIQSNGNAASANTAGAALAYSSATLGATTVGTVGGAGATGASNAGTNGAANGLGGAGGAGGASAVPHAGGAGGTATAPTAAVQLPFSNPLAVMGRLQTTTAFASIIGGSGGGGGGGDATNLSGGGGGGAGVVVVVAQRISGAGTIEAVGGAGGNASSTGNSAGGGGGGGGVVIVVSRSVVPVSNGGPSLANTTQVVSVAGGAGGTGTGTGLAGVAGSAGTKILIAA
jgi:hypothetical protein